MSTDKTSLENGNKPSCLDVVSGSVLIIDEGNVNYHLQRGGIDHQYFIDEKKEYATCQCGRVLHYR